MATDPQQSNVPPTESGDVAAPDDKVLGQTPGSEEPTTQDGSDTSAAQNVGAPIPRGRERPTPGTGQSSIEETTSAAMRAVRDYARTKAA